MTSETNPLGRVLRVKQGLDGLTEVHLDNGPTKKIQLVTYGSSTELLLAEDLVAIREHLMTRKPGHFRKKPKR